MVVRDTLTGHPYIQLFSPVPHTVLRSFVLLCCHCRSLNHGRSFSRGTVPLPRAAPQERNRCHVFSHTVPRIWRPWSTYRHPRHRRGSRGPRHAGKADRLPHGSLGLVPSEANASTGRARSNQWANCRWAETASWLTSSFSIDNILFHRNNCKYSP